MNGKCFEIPENVWSGELFVGSKRSVSLTYCNSPPYPTPNGRNSAEDKLLIR